MAVIVIDDRTIRNEADATTNWTAAGTSTGTATGTASPTPREADAHIVTTATSNTPANQWLWHTGASLGVGPHLVYIWMLTTATIGTRTNGGLMILIGDGTNRVGYHVGGDDFAPFRVDSNGLVGYMCFCIDTEQLSTWPFGVTVQAGTRGGLEANLNAITQIGTGCQVLAKAVGGAVNYWNDIIRVGVATNINTSGLTIRGGTSGSPGKFSEIEVEDRSIANQKAHGIIRQLGTGVFGVQGTLRFGDQGTDSSWFEETNVTIVFEDRGFKEDRYKIVITDNGVGTTTFKLGRKIGSGSEALGANGVSMVSPPGVGAYFDSGTDTDVTDVFIYGSSFVGFSEGLVLRNPQEFINNTVANCGTIIPNGAYMFNCSIISSIAPSALFWDVNINTNDRLDGCSFVSSGTGHAIEFGPNTPSSITLRNVTYSSYATSDGTTGNEVIYNNSGKEIDITISGGAIPTIRNGVGSTTNIISGLVTITLTNLQPNTEVRVYEDDGGQNGDEIDGVENSSTSFSFSVSEGETINIIINSLNFLPADIWGFVVPSVNTSIPVSQFIDRQYFNPT
jgi:hypothetical protein